MKVILLIIISFSISICGFSQVDIDDIKSKMKGTWKGQDLTKKQKYLNKISFSSDSTGQWSIEGIICDCEFFKIYEDDSKVYIQRLIILDGWSDPIEIVSVDKKKLVVKHSDGQTLQYRRERNKKIRKSKNETVPNKT